MRRLHRGEKGFTLIELLIVIAILGIIAAIVIPNAAGFMGTADVNAANTEVANVKTAGIGFMAENDGNWPTTEISGSGGVLDPYLTGDLIGVYNYDQAVGNEGLIATATYKDLVWDAAGQKFNRP